MEIKKSHKADLEHKRPLMFLAGLVITIVSFFLILECSIAVSNINFEEEDDIEMDLDMKPKDERDLIAAQEKLQQKEKDTEHLNKVDESQELALELPEPEEKPNEELKETEEEPPINLNEDDPEIERIVEELPQFPGGMGEYVKWLTANLQYPPVPLRQKIQGKVMVSFIVNTDGTISDLKLVQRCNAYLDNEAMRVMRLMPQWTPGKDHGKVCRTRVAVPVVFAI